MPETKNLIVGQHVYRVFPGGGLSASAYWVDRIVGSRIRLTRPSMAIWVTSDEVAV